MGASTMNDLSELEKKYKEMGEEIERLKKTDGELWYLDQPVKRTDGRKRHMSRKNKAFISGGNSRSDEEGVFALSAYKWEPDYEAENIITWIPNPGGALELDDKYTALVLLTSGVVRSYNTTTGEGFHWGNDYAIDVITHYAIIRPPVKLS